MKMFVVLKVGWIWQQPCDVSNPDCDVGGPKYGDLKTPQMCIYLPLRAPPLTVSKNECYMSNQYFVFSIIVAVLSGSLVSKGTPKKIKMPPKPRLNVQNFPRPPLLERTDRHLQIKWHGQIVADTKDAYWVLETYHAPSIVFFFSPHVQIIIY